MLKDRRVVEGQAPNRGLFGSCKYHGMSTSGKSARQINSIVPGCLLDAYNLVLSNRPASDDASTWIGTLGRFSAEWSAHVELTRTRQSSTEIAHSTRGTTRNCENTGFSSPKSAPEAARAIVAMLSSLRQMRCSSPSPRCVSNSARRISGYASSARNVGWVVLGSAAGDDDSLSDDMRNTSVSQLMFAVAGVVAVWPYSCIVGSSPPVDCQSTAG